MSFEQSQDLRDAQVDFLDTSLEVADAFFLWSRCFVRGDPSTKDSETNYLQLLAVLAEKGKALNATREMEPKP